MAKPFDKAAYGKAQSDLGRQLLADAKAFLLENLASHQLSQEKMIALIKFRLQFPSRSFKNTMLLAMQMPGATCLLGYKQWKSKGRMINKGSKALGIFYPQQSAPLSHDNDVIDDNDKTGRRTYFVFKRRLFDISQTTIIPGREDDALQDPPRLIGELEGDSHQELYNLLLEYGRSVLGYTIETDELARADGCCVYSNPVRIVLASRLESVNHKLHVLLHEIAHAQMHHVSDKLRHLDNYESSQQMQEVQAETFSYFVSAVFGLDTHTNSFPYINSWADNNTDAVFSNFATVDKVAIPFISALEEHISSLNNSVQLAA